jgi:DNA replication protein DnaC
VSPSRKPTRLRAITQVWATIAEQSDKEGWPAPRFLAALAEHEIADRGRRRIERHLAEARLPVGKPSTASTSMQCRWSEKRRSWP